MSRDCRINFDRRLIVWASVIALFSLVSHSAEAEDGRTNEERLRIVFAGDVMLDGGPGHVVGNGGDPFADVATILQGADLSVCNLECVISEKGEPLVKSYTFLGKPESIPLLKKYFSAVSVANNHSGDYGKEAFADELDLLEKAKLPYFGGGKNIREARRPLILASRGRKVALLGYCDFPPRSFAAAEKTPGTAWLIEADVLADIRAAKSVEHADLVIPVLHWGDELEPAPEEEQKVLARKMIDAGADAVIGSHPHVTQTIDYYRGRPIVYSLGNFVFDYFPTDPPKWYGWIEELSFSNSGVDLTTHTVELDPAGVPHLSPRTEKAEK
jgi:poly-gamma-glutamate capsule biosynthesis protein CapA/YwtB (metallophosphatase superfamily)